MTLTLQMPMHKFCRKELEVVDEIELARGKNRIEADAASLLVGQYILLVKMAEERFIKKVIKL